MHASRNIRSCFYGSVVGLSSLILFLSGVNVAWGGGGGAPPTNTLMFTETLKETVGCQKNADKHLVCGLVTGDIVSIAGKVLLPDANFATFGPTTAFELTLGGVRVSHQLHSDPHYTDGNTSATFLESYLDAKKKTVVSLTTTLKWTAKPVKQLTVTVIGKTSNTASPGWMSIRTDTYAGQASATINENLIGRVAFGGTSVTFPTVAVTGTVVTKPVTAGDHTQLAQSAVNIRGTGVGVPAASPTSVTNTEIFLLKLDSLAAVYNNPPNQTLLTVSNSTHISKILTYHWNNGSGATPGTIGLKNTGTGIVIGTWTVVASQGLDSTPGVTWTNIANGPPYRYWTVQPNVDISAGTYEVVDSNPATWSYNSDTGNRGMAFVYGWKLASSGGDPYGVAPVVAGTTTPETKNITASPGTATTLALSDGTSVSAPSVSQSFSLTVNRQTNNIQLSDASLKPTGSMRIITYDDLHLAAAYYPVTITFPASEFGSVNKDTLAVARIGDVIVNGVLERDHLSLLPATVVSNGLISATDDLLPATDGVALSTATVQSGVGSPAAATLRAVVTYVLVTIQNNINWNQPAFLVRMIPDGNLSAKRKNLDQLSAAEKVAETNRCIRNVIVLVHGHNEAEKTGGQLILEGDAEAPWFFSYKRDVWTQFYQTFITKYAHNGQSSCTAFYEYIYPSWRSAFDYSGPDLAVQLKREFQGLLSSQNADPNILIVAHSMGGLVARTAIQNFDANLHQAFQSLVTWGTPHRGSALVSFSYLLTSPFPYLPNGFDPATQMGWAKSAVENYLQIDTPGTRDLRWDNSRPLTLGNLFSLPLKTGAVSEYRLDTGTRLYSDRTRTFNENDVYGSPALNGANNKWGGLKYNFAYGITTKWWPNDGLGGIAAGATATRTLIATNGQYLGVTINEGDGAVPITSMAAEGLVGYRWNLGDCDHEEYYGSAKGPAVADYTFGWLRIFTDAQKDYFKCDPFIESLSPTTGASGSLVTIKGRCFNNLDNRLTVSFNGTTVALTTNQVRCNEMIVTVPPGATTGPVVVTAAGVASNGKNYTVTNASTHPWDGNWAGNPGTGLVTYSLTQNNNEIEGTYTRVRSSGSESGTVSGTINGIRATGTMVVGSGPTAGKVTNFVFDMAADGTSISGYLETASGSSQSPIFCNKTN